MESLFGSKTQTVLDFLMCMGLCHEAAGVFIRPTVTDSRGQSFQPDAVVQCKDRTLYILAVRSSEPDDMETLKELLLTMEHTIFSPYPLNLNAVDHSEVLLIFDSAGVQAAAERYLSGAGYAAEFPLFLSNAETQILQCYPRKNIFHQGANRICRIFKRAFEQ